MRRCGERHNGQRTGMCECPEARMVRDKESGVIRGLENKGKGNMKSELRE